MRTICILGAATLATAVFAAGVDPATAPAVPVAAAAVARPAPLHLGSHGARVRALQQRLIAVGYLPAGTADGVFDMGTWHAVVAFQGWQRLHRDGVVGARTLRSLASATRPRPWITRRRALELDLQRQVLLVVVRGRTVRAVHISSAAPGRTTPRGHFHVYRRELLSWSGPYQVWMPHALYFSGGYAIHGFSVVPAYPASHGCVRMPLTDAPFVYTATPLGTPVWIR